MAYLTGTKLTLKGEEDDFKENVSFFYTYEQKGVSRSMSVSSYVLTR